MLILLISFQQSIVLCKFANKLRTQIVTIRNSTPMRKFALSILNCFIGVSCFAGLPSDTTYYYYHDASFDKILESKTSFNDEVLMIVSEGNAKSCYFYGCSNEFSDDPAEGVTPGFIVLKATSWSMEKGKFTCVLNSTNHKYVNRPVNAGVVEEIPNGYNPWLQINDYFWSQIELVGTYNSKKIELINKTLYPEEKKVFRKISSSEIKALYNKDLLSDAEAEANSEGYVSPDDSF